MKHIKKFNESSEEEDNLVSDLKLILEEVADTLTIEVFDEFNIRFIDLNDSNVKSNIFNIGEFWAYESDKIIIGNLDSQLFTNIMNEIITVKPIIYGRSGVEIDLECHARIGGGQYKSFIYIKILK